MSINVQKLIDEIKTRFNNLDSNSSLSEITRINELNTRKDASALTGGIQYKSLNQANAPSGIGDSANVGQIFFVADEQLDTEGRFYFRSQGGFVNMKTEGDSDENALIDSARTNQSSGDAAPSGPSFVYQGDTRAFVLGGRTPSTPYVNTIQTISYVTDGNATDIADLTTPRAFISAHGDGDYAYAAGGHSPTAPVSNILERTPFATDANAVDIGDASIGRYYGSAANDATHGYQMGGYAGPPNAWTNSVDRYPFGSTSSGTDIGDITPSPTILGMTSGNSSATHGYTVGGYNADPATPTPETNQIYKFPFAATLSATDIANSLETARRLGSSSSTDNGYSFGIGPSPAAPFTNTNRIEKFPFATDANATDVGDMTSATRYNTGSSSTTHGYHMGGNPRINNIGKFTFASDANATDVGDLIAVNDFMSATGSND